MAIGEIEIKISLNQDTSHLPVIFNVKQSKKTIIEITNAIVIAIFILNLRARTNVRRLHKSD